MIFVNLRCLEMKLIHFLELYMCVCMEWGRWLYVQSDLTDENQLYCGSSAAMLVQCCIWKSGVTFKIASYFSVICTHGFEPYFWQNLLVMVPGRPRSCAVSPGGDDLICAKLVINSLK